MLSGLSRYFLTGQRARLFVARENHNMNGNQHYRFAYVGPNPYAAANRLGQLVAIVFGIAGVLLLIGEFLAAVGKLLFG
jgi:hypothetical protein